MNKPVNFPIAKLLKEKGYDIPCLKCYLEDGSVQISSGDEGDLEEYNHNQWDNYSAPTIAEVVMWLYEKHGIWISVIDVSSSQILWEYQISKKEVGLIHSSGQYPAQYNYSPTEAYEAAITYTLTNLI